jgi:hypothetical protein
MKHLITLLLATPILLPASALFAQEKPCNFLTKSKAESILGVSVVQRKDDNYDCWFVRDEYGGANNKQVRLSIWRSPSPKADDVNKRRADIAQDRTAHLAVKDVTDFADAALWAWTPGWGRFNAFKGGTIEVEVIIGGIAEDAALQSAKKLAAGPLGGSGKSGFAYAGAAPAGAPEARAGGGPATLAAQSPASYSPAWMGQNRVVRGTVSRVDIKSTGYPRWLTIYFKESPDAAFVVCSPHPDMFQETVGDLYRLVGKTLEVTGQVEGSMCAGKGGSIRVLESMAYRVQDLPAQPAGRLAVPPARDPMKAYAGLDICNAGKAEFDAIVARRGSVASTHLAPADCANVYDENGASPAYVGFAFADTRGQWGAPRRIDVLPNSFDKGLTDIWYSADQSVSVKHGTRDISLRMQMLFRPPVPSCHTSAYDPTNPIVPKTICDWFNYTLNVVTYPETREVTFYKKCYVCPETQSPEERTREKANTRQVVQSMSRVGPLGGIVGGLVARAQTEGLKESIEGPPDPQSMNWNEMNQALAKVRPSGRPPEMPQYLAIRGTVSRVDVSPPQATEHWVNVYFLESPEQGGFNVCTSDPEIFVEMFGPDFRSRMVGQVLEVEGEYQRAYCKGLKGSIRLTLAHQVRKVAGN